MLGRMPVGSAIAVAVIAVGTVACGGGTTSYSASPKTTIAGDATTPGDIPDTQAFVDFSPSTGTYHVSLPEGWARTDLPTGASLSDKENSIRVEAQPSPETPTVASVTATDVPALRAAGDTVSSVRLVTRPAGDAVLVRYEARGSNDPVTGRRLSVDVERYQFWMNGTTVTLTLSGTKGADNVDPWRTVTNSFRWSM
jgi:hypothetical protein